MPRNTAGSSISWGLVLAASLMIGRGAAAQPVQLSDSVVNRPAIGLTTTLPEGTTRSSYEIGGRSADRITFPGMAAFVNVTEVYLTQAKALPEVADAIINEHLASVSSLDVKADKPINNEPGLRTAKGRLLSREHREINGWPAEVFYVQLASMGGEDSVYGYALFMPTANTIARLELQTTESDLPRARPYFEAMVNSTLIVDPDVASAKRAEGVEAGNSFFQSLTPKDVEGVIRWLGDDWHAERFYQPAENGSDRDATELGYRLTRYAIGKRGDLKSDADRGNIRPEDRQRGYLVFQKARILRDDQMIDIEAGFFFTPDRSQEMWTIKQAVRPLRAPDAPATGLVTETGVRERSALSVSRVAKDGPVQTINPAIEGAGYISWAEVLLLPYLLMQKDAPGDYRFYAYNQVANRVTLREDILEPPTADRGTWRYTSRASEASQPMVATYDSRMDLVRAERAENQVWEPISVRRLADLWKQKKLPID